jgi:hypothetical protein
MVQKQGSPKNKTKRCKKGERKNPKTGICETPPTKKERPAKTEKTDKVVRKKNTTKMSVKETKIFETRKKCIQDFREKLPKLSL